MLLATTAAKEDTFREIVQSRAPGRATDATRLGTWPETAPTRERMTGSATTVALPDISPETARRTVAALGMDSGVVEVCVAITAMARDTLPRTAQEKTE